MLFFPRMYIHDEDKFKPNKRVMMRLKKRHKAKAVGVVIQLSLYDNHDNVSKRL